MTRPQPAALFFAALLCASLAPGASSQEPETAQESSQGEIKRLEAWPAPKKASAVRKEITRLRKGSTEGMIEQSGETLRGFGAAAAPLLIEALGASTLAAEKHDAAADRLVQLLDEITGPAHTRLIAKEYSAKSPRVRSWALRRSAAWPDAGTLAAAEEALQTETKRPLEQFPDLAFDAAIAATTAGSVLGLDTINARSIEDWSKIGTRVRSALEQVRGEDASAKLAVHLGDSNRKKIVAALRMLAGCGTTSAIPAIVPHLQSKDASILIAAINACRGIVDGDPPLARMSVFQAVEKAKPWLKRL